MAGRLMSGRRSRLGTSLVDMSLFLRRNFEEIPATVPEMGSSWQSHIPKLLHGKKLWINCHMY